MDPRDLRRFAESVRIAHVGWFRAREFPGYLRAVEEREEYHRFDYRPHAAFLKAGRPHDKVKTIVAIAVDYFHDRDYMPGEFKVSNYSRFCWNTVEAKSKLIIDYLKRETGGAEAVDVPARAAACRAGLGFIGKNTMFHAHGLGSYVGIMAIGVGVDLPEEHPAEEQVKNPACAKCRRCVEACPTGAISPEGYCINPLRCVSFINRHADEHRKDAPEDRSRLDGWLHGCEVCQDVCPLNVKIRHRKDVVASPEIALYGMRLPNTASVSGDRLRENMGRITSPGFREYVGWLLEDRA